MKRIALYYPWLHLTSGVERTILELINNSHHHYTVFTNHFDPAHTFPEFKNIRVIQLRPISVKRNLISVIWSAVRIATQKIDLTGFDLLMVHSEGLGDLIQIRNHSLPVMCICHTPLRISFDSYYISHKPAYRIFGDIFKLFDRYLWKNYTSVVFNSQESYRRALSGKLIVPKQKNIHIIHPGINWSEIRPVNVYKPYFLIAGRIMWTKQVELGLSSYIKAKKSLNLPPNFHLIISGQVDKKSQPYYSRLRRLAEGHSDIKFIINPSDRELASLYSECWSVINCAFNEDWGLTILEAAAYSKPVLAVASGGPLESIIHNRTGLLVANSQSEIAASLVWLSKNKQQVVRMGSSARVNVKKYDWKNYVNKLDPVLDLL